MEKMDLKNKLHFNWSMDLETRVAFSNTQTWNNLSCLVYQAIAVNTFSCSFV